MTNTPSRGKTILVFVLTIIFAFILFILPNLFLGISKVNGGLQGINLLWMALFQLVTVLALLRLALRKLGHDFGFIGWTRQRWKKDALLGTLVGLAWTAVQFLWLIPNTGGAQREDIAGMLSMMDGTMLGLVSYIALGVIGGGITEEFYNRGFFIHVLQSTFKKPKTGLWVASILSILFFAVGHLPSDAIGWLDILIPTLAYTLLFVSTKRLTAPIFAHGIYNLTAILATHYMYYPQ